jgi:hypothetical protein
MGAWPAMRLPGQPAAPAYPRHIAPAQGHPAGRSQAIWHAFTLMSKKFETLQ